MIGDRGEYDAVLTITTYTVLTVLTVLTNTTYTVLMHMYSYCSLELCCGEFDALILLVPPLLE